MNKFVASVSPDPGDEARNVKRPHPRVPGNHFDNPDNYEDATEVYGDQ
jgi:hypothetical protein